MLRNPSGHGNPARVSHQHTLIIFAVVLWLRETMSDVAACEIVLSSWPLSPPSFRAATPVTLGTTMPSRRPASCWTCCCRKMPGQGPAPTPRALGRESLAAPWDLVLVPMEPLPHIQVNGTYSDCKCTSLSNISSQADLDNFDLNDPSSIVKLFSLCRSFS